MNCIHFYTFKIQVWFCLGPKTYYYMKTFFEVKNMNPTNTKNI